MPIFIFFFFNDTATTEIYTLSLHDALPICHGSRVYQVENGSRLKAFDLETGRELWKLPLGTVQKAPLVLADGKLYVGTESGKFFIVRPGPDKAEVLSEVLLPLSKNSVQQAEGT